MDIHTILWGWGIVSFILFPIIGFVFAKLDLEAEEGMEVEESTTGGLIAGAGVVAALWPLVLAIGLGFLIFVAPTLYVVETTKTRHRRRRREEATEKEVLAQIEAEQKAKDDAIKREIDGPPTVADGVRKAIEAEPWTTVYDSRKERPHKNPQGRLRKSQNAEFAKRRSITIDGGKLDVELDWGRRERPSKRYLR